MNDQNKPHAGKTSNINQRPIRTFEIVVRDAGKIIALTGTEYRTALDGTLHIYNGARIIRSLNVHYWLDIKEKK